ncbi:hypothetical protein GDO81_022682 [Engystomops pustulosus]|uniref:Uncharacterized protein n=1 Tax=Engystomops pustulosus TaxID=76066 RepID=A0AAV6ZLS0_ENGPU|nr:hypothetical protein GDO81_022682 [Engystomops pustulosus]
MWFRTGSASRQGQTLWEAQGSLSLLDKDRQAMSYPSDRSPFREMGMPLQQARLSLPLKEMPPMGTTDRTSISPIASSAITLRSLLRRRGERARLLSQSRSLRSRSLLSRSPLSRSPLSRSPLSRSPLSRSPFSRSPLSRASEAPPLLIRLKSKSSKSLLDTGNEGSSLLITGGRGAAVVVVVVAAAAVVVLVVVVVAGLDGSSFCCGGTPGTTVPCL